MDTSDLQHADRETQLAEMRRWFHANYEDPVENTPYESAEGGYQYIWGGPYDAREQLENEFSGVVPDELIDELATELDDITPVWTRNPDKLDSSEQFDDYLYRQIAESSKPIAAFTESMLNVKRLLETKIEAADWQCFLRLLYVNVITALETYLSDIFISSVNADRALFRKLVETAPEFQSQKIPLSAVFQASEQIDQRVKTYLSELVWHRLDRVKPMFRDVLGVDFPADMKELFKAIVIRHDLVHRNGKTTDGKEHLLDIDAIKALIAMAEQFVTYVESQPSQPTDATRNLKLET